MKRKKKSNYSWRISKALFFIIFGMLLSYTLLLTLGDPVLHIKKFFEEEQPPVDISITEGCTNLDIFESALCLQKNVKSFYKYNDDNIGEDLTFDELVQQGGVCVHYSSLYYNAGIELGFYADEIIIDSTEDTGHIFTIISNTDGYCLLDGTLLQCYKFEQ